MPAFGPFPIEEGAVQPAAVVSLFRILLIGIVVQGGDFIAAVNQRHARFGQELGVNQEDALGGEFLLVEIMILQRHLQTSQAGQGAAVPGIEGLGIEFVQLTARMAEGMVALVEADQVLLMGFGRKSHGLENVVIEPPTDVVVTAGIGDPASTVRDLEAIFDTFGHQAGIAGRKRVPDVDHVGGVVENLAFLVLICAEIFDDLERLDDRFAEQNEAGADHVHDQTEHLEQGMDRGQVAAIGAKLFPHERDGIEADDGDAGIGQVEQDIGHAQEDLWIVVVEVPLEFIKGCEDPFLDLLVIGEIAGGDFGEDFRDGFFEFSRNIVRVVHEIEILVLFFAGEGTQGPFMVFGRMVDDIIEANVDPLGAQPGDQITELVHRSETGIDFTVVRHSISTVILTFPSLEQGHEMDVGDAQLLEIGDLLDHTGQITGKQVGVEHHAHQPVGHVPGKIALVGLLQRRGPGCRGSSHDLEQMVDLGLAVVGVETGEKVLELFLLVGLVRKL